MAGVIPDEMQQTKRQNVTSKSAILYAAAGLLLIGAVAALSIAASGKNLRAAGLMPEVVVTAEYPRLVVDEVVVRASHPARLADVATRTPVVN